MSVWVDPDPRSWMSVRGQHGGFVGLFCLRHGEFWCNDDASWREVAAAVESHVATSHPEWQVEEKK